MKISVVGATGKVGRLVTENIMNSKFELKEAIISSKNPLFGTKIPCFNEQKMDFNRKFTDKLTEIVDFVIDFSLPHATLVYLKQAVDLNIPYVIGTTGFTSNGEDLIKEYSKKIPILKAGNFSYGINIINKILQEYAIKLQEYDIEVIDIHHKNKIDAPSETALNLVQTIEKSVKNNKKFSVQNSIDRLNKREARPEKNININAIRGGGNFGEHKIIFMDENEEITISQRALNRSIYSTSAIRAGMWLMKKKPGLYNMEDYINDHS